MKWHGIRHRHQNTLPESRLFHNLAKLWKAQIDRHNIFTPRDRDIMADLHCRRQRMDHVRHNPDLIQRVEAYDSLRRVRHTDAHSVAAPHAKPQKGIRAGLDVPVQLRVSRLSPKIVITVVIHKRHRSALHKLIQ